MKRTPSKPLLGTPVVVGTSVAVMAIRSVPCAIEGARDGDSSEPGNAGQHRYAQPCPVTPSHGYPPLPADYADREAGCTRSRVSGSLGPRACQGKFQSVGTLLEK